MFATDADSGPDIDNSKIPNVSWVTEKNRVLIGFDQGNGSRGYTCLDRKEALELAVFLAQCASHMEDM